MDLVLLGGNVLTMDNFNRRAEAVAVRGGKIAAVGASAEIEKLIAPETQVVRLAGRTVTPGFVDPHNHFSISTLDPVAVDCSVPPHDSIPSILEAIAAAAKGSPKGQWIRGWGFRSRSLREGRRITRWELDEAAPNNPVCIVEGSVHGVTVNSLALRLAGIDRHTPDPSHGVIVRDDKEEPNGTLWEQAENMVYGLSLRAHLDYYGEGIADLVCQNCMRHLALGITSVGDALVVPEAAEMYHLTDSQEKLPMVVHQMLGGDGFFDHPDKVAKGELHDGNVSDRLRGGTVKMFMDPVFPSAARIRFYADGTEERFGERYYTQEEADAIVLNAHKSGLQIAIHCLGTWSIEQALHAFEQAQRQHPQAEPRFRIEHYSMPTLAQIKKTRSLGVIATVQPPFILGADQAASRAQELGGVAKVHPYRTMLDEGVMVAASSDCPCAPLNPMLGMWAMVTRHTRSGGGPVAPEEAVTPMEGLRMYTMNAAYAMRREGEVGSLEAGKRADIVVLSHDPTMVGAEFLRDVMVERTYVEGQLLYQR